MRKCISQNQKALTAEGAVVGVLLYCHDLDSVVPQAADAGQNLLLELQVAVDLGLLQPLNSSSV